MTPAGGKNSNGDRRFDRGMRIVFAECEILEAELADIFDRGI